MTNVEKKIESAQVMNEKWLILKLQVHTLPENVCSPSLDPEMGDNSSSTSSEDKSDFNENPTRDALADGIMSFLKPRVDNLYKVVDTAKESQLNLASELDSTLNDLDKVFQGEDDGVDFQKYADTIAEMRHQITVIDNVLQSASSRLENITGKMQALQKSRKPHFENFASSEKN